MRAEGVARRAAQREAFDDNILRTVDAEERLVHDWYADFRESAFRRPEKELAVHEAPFPGMRKKLRCAEERHARFFRKAVAVGRE